MAGFDWKGFENALLEELEWGLTRLGRACRHESFYAVALHGVDREADRMLSLPTLAANTAKAGAASGAADFWSERWNPADWEHPEIPLRAKQGLQLERSLNRESNAGTPGHWARTERRYLTALVNVTRRLRDRAPSILKVTDDFVVFLSDEEGGPALARKSIPASLFGRLFPATVAVEKQRREVNDQGPSERAAFLVTRLRACEGITWEEAERELFALGETAIPHLLEVLGNGDIGPNAARILGAIGVASDAVLKALRARAGTGLWYAMALGVLGDNDWLAGQGDAGVAVLGLTAPLKAIATKHRTPRLDYRPLESYLASAGDPARKRAETELEPGRSYRSMCGDDVAEALRGLASPHAVVRWHAASLLGDRELGKTAGQQILPALALRLEDRHRFVRRLAILSMSRWKTAVRPYRDAFAAVANDPDETVARTARALLK